MGQKEWPAMTHPNAAKTLCPTIILFQTKGKKNSQAVIKEREEGLRASPEYIIQAPTSLSGHIGWVGGSGTAVPMHSLPFFFLLLETQTSEQWIRCRCWEG